VIIADTSGLLALFNDAEPDHESVARLVTDEYHQLVVSPYVLAELDYLVGTRIGVTDASLVVLADRFRTRRVLTLDRRHFRVLRPLAGGDFELIP